MCGRFSQYSLGNAFYELFEIEVNENFIPKKSVFPGQDALIVMQDVKSGKRIAKNSHWGYLPSWADPTRYKKVINARVETIHDKPYFKSSVKSHRCIIPVNGFFEWHRGDQKKEGYYFSKEDRSVFYLAGLYDSIKGQSDHESFCVITKDADHLVSPVHERMPFILSENKAILWISGESEFLLDEYRDADCSSGLIIRSLSEFSD